MKRSISVKIILNIILILLLLGFASTLWIQYTLRTNLETSLKEKGILISNQISISSVESMITGNKTDLRKILDENKSSIKDISYIFITDESNNVFMHTFEKGFPLQLLWVNIIDQNQRHGIKLISIDGENIYDVVVPIKVDNFMIGSTHVGISLDLIKESINRLRLQSTLTVLLLVLIGIFLTFRLAQGIIKPIRELNLITENITETEDLNTPVLIKSGDEMEVLANSFDRMREKLKLSRENIEKTVDERTYELKLEIREREKKEEKLNKVANELKNAYKELESSQLAALNIMEDLSNAKLELESDKLKLIEQQKELKKVNEELDNFVYIASHDLRAPLRGISSYASFLAEDCQEILGTDEKKYLEQIQESAKRMDTLLNDLLTLSRVSRIKNPYSEADINVILHDIMENLKFEIEHYKIKISVREKIPQIYCDKIKISQVFSNLIDNAIKFSTKENDEPKIDIGFEEKKNHFEFWVEDNGIGISEEFYTKIFEPFTKLHPQQVYKGTGVGLNIVKKIIEEHGGKIWVDSTIGKGTVFYFTIP
ncbi:MAG: ATP-binding protein, partial [bacterium]|nr:ATP-binding protein [bacterium]